MLYYIMLYYVVLYCIILYYIVLYYIMLCYIILYFRKLYNIILLNKLRGAEGSRGLVVPGVLGGRGRSRNSGLRLFRL